MDLLLERESIIKDTVREVRLPTGLLTVKARSGRYALDALVGFAARANAKRGFLFVSKIFGMVIGPMVGGFVSLYSIGKYGRGSGKWDYSAGFLVYFALGLAGCLLYFLLVEPSWRKGKFAGGGDVPTPVIEPIAPSVP